MINTSAEMAQAFTRAVMQILESLNGRQLMLRADFDRLGRLVGERVNRELPRVFGEFQAALREVEAQKAPSVIPRALVLAEASAVACEVWMEYGKQSRQELAKQ